MLGGTQSPRVKYKFNAWFDTYMLFGRVRRGGQGIVNEACNLGHASYTPCRWKYNPPEASPRMVQRSWSASSGS